MAENNTSITADQQVARVFEWRRGFNTIHLIDVGIKTGIFRALAEAPGSSPHQLAERLKLDQHCVDVWCKTAFGMELLDGDADDVYRLAPHMDQILANPTHPRYLGGYVRLGTEFAAEDFQTSPEAFRTGRMRPFQNRGDAFSKCIAESTLGLQVVTAKKIMPGLAGLGARMESGGVIAELGCGSGNFLLQAAKAFPKARCIGVDIDEPGLAAARSKVAAAGLQERIEVRSGRFGEVVKSGSVDVVVMIEVLHEISADIRPEVVKSAASALAPGGWMVIVDETYPTTREEMRQAEFKFPLMTAFEELTWGNVIPTRVEQERLLRDAGFAGDIGRQVIGEGFTVLTTQK